jgi:hypothetical protein
LTTIKVDLFCEDNTHEACGRALVNRAAAGQSVGVSLRIASAQCGIPRLKRELRAFQEVVCRTAGRPDVLVILIDANRVGSAVRRREITETIAVEAFPSVVIGTPDPCIERWLFADPVSFAARFGTEPRVSATRDRGAWKTRLIDALTQSGEIVTQGGAEFAEEIFESMDLYRAGRSVPTLETFMADLSGAFRQLT